MEEKESPKIINTSIISQLSKSDVSTKKLPTENNYFWSGLSPYQYLDALDRSREKATFNVSNWIEESTLNLDTIIPIMLKGIDNLHKKIIDTELIWTNSLKNIKLIIIREQNYLSKIQNYKIMDDFNEVYRIESR